MPGRESSPAREAGGESYLKVLGTLASVLLALLMLGSGLLSGLRPSGNSIPSRQAAVKVPTAIPVASPAPSVKNSPAVQAFVQSQSLDPPPQLDREAVARAEERLDSVSRDRARAEARAEESSERLASATIQAAADSRAARSLNRRVRDPSPRITQAIARGRFLRAEKDQLAAEIRQLATLPRPRTKILSNKNPVARPSEGDEFHFEVRRDRVSFIDLERLLALVKADAHLRIRLSDGARAVDSQVGPAGAFSLRYLLGKSLPRGLEELMERKSLSYDLQGWEIIPEFEGRGETYEATRHPISEFARVIHRISPHKATITMWVYPDGFNLYRKLRDDLQEKGFLVAARPLPEGIAIRGSPSGSLSAGQ
ncbi:MAG: hypothetical protein NVSMB9_31180 [Isosphaeraceae bacterium]